MTTFELGFLILMACGVACIATYLAWCWLHDTAIAERDSARTALTSTQNALRHAQEAPCGRCDEFATQWAEEVERRLELEHAAAHLREHQQPRSRPMNPELPIAILKSLGFTDENIKKISSATIWLGVNDFVHVDVSHIVTNRELDPPFEEIARSYKLVPNDIEEETDQ